MWPQRKEVKRVNVRPLCLYLSVGPLACCLFCLSRLFLISSLFSVYGISFFYNPVRRATSITRSLISVGARRCQSGRSTSPQSVNRPLSEVFRSSLSLFAVGFLRSYTYLYILLRDGESVFVCFPLQIWSPLDLIRQVYRVVSFRLQCLFVKQRPWP